MPCRLMQLRNTSRPSGTKGLENEGSRRSTFPIAAQTAPSDREAHPILIHAEPPKVQLPKSLWSGLGKAGRHHLARPRAVMVRPRSSPPRYMRLSLCLSATAQDGPGTSRGSVPPSATGRAYFLGPGIWRRNETNKQEEAMFRMPPRYRCLAGSSLVVLHWAVLWIGDAVAILDGRGICAGWRV